MHTLLRVLGVDDLTGPWYGFWSGFGSDLAYLGIIGALMKRWTCEVHHCYRLGVHQTAAGHRVCRKHHPDPHLTSESVSEAHRAAQG